MRFDLCALSHRHQLRGIQRFRDRVRPQRGTQRLVAGSHWGADDRRRNPAQTDRWEEESRRRRAEGTRGERKRRRRVQRWVVIIILSLTVIDWGIHRDKWMFSSGKFWWTFSLISYKAVYLLIFHSLTRDKANFEDNELRLSLQKWYKQKEK